MPIPKRVVYDGKSKIKVKAKKWEDQHEERRTSGRGIRG